MPWITALLLFPTSASAQTRTNQSGHIGLGLGVGSHVGGVSAKWVPADSHAIQVLLGASGPYEHNDADPAIEVDYLYRMPTLVDEDAVSVGWTLGGGGTVGNPGPFLSGQGIAGLHVDLLEAPVDFGVEVRPGLIFAGPFGGLAFALNFGAHIRVWI